MGYEDIATVITLVDSKYEELVSKVEDAISDLNTEAEDDGVNKRYNLNDFIVRYGVFPEETDRPANGTDADSSRLDDSLSLVPDKFSFVDNFSTDPIVLSDVDYIEQTGSVGSAVNDSSITLPTSALKSSIDSLSFNPVLDIVDAPTASADVDLIAGTIFAETKDYKQVIVKTPDDVGWTPELWREFLKDNPTVDPNDVLDIMQSPNLQVLSYDSDVLEALEQSVIDIYTQGYETVLTLSLWQKDRAKLIQELSDTTDEIDRTFARKGFPAPISLSLSAKLNAAKKSMADRAASVVGLTDQQAQTMQSLYETGIDIGVEIENIRSKMTLAYKNLYFGAIDYLLTKFKAELRAKVSAYGLDLKRIKLELEESRTNAELYGDTQAVQESIDSTEIKTNIREYNANIGQDLANLDIASNVANANLTYTTAKLDESKAIRAAYDRVYGAKVDVAVSGGKAELASERANAEIVSSRLRSEVSRVKGELAKYAADVKLAITEGTSSVKVANANSSFTAAQVEKEIARINSKIKLLRAKTDIDVMKGQSELTTAKANVMFAKTEALTDIEEQMSYIQEYDAMIGKDITQGELKATEERINAMYQENIIKKSLAELDTLISKMNTNIESYISTYNDKLSGYGYVVDTYTQQAGGWGQVFNKIDLTTSEVEAGA